MLRLQRQIVISVRSGFRPLQPVARGLDDPLADFPVSLPNPSSVPDHVLLSPDCLPEASPLPAAVLPPPAAGPLPPVVDEDLCSLSSESTDSDSAGEDVAEPAPALADPSAALATAHLEGKGFLWNARSNVFHVAVATSSGAPRSRSFRWGRSLAAARGARTSQLHADSLFSAVPEGSVLCPAVFTV